MPRRPGSGLSLLPMSLLPSRRVVHLTIVLDAFSRRIVGWSMADHLRTEPVLDALEIAICRGLAARDEDKHETVETHAGRAVAGYQARLRASVHRFESDGPASICA